MSDTLTALSAAIIDAPADRTVRLIYADALDEIGASSDALLAEFIRAQIAFESLHDDNSPERERLAARCQELFTANWIDWWRPVCIALGLPEPHVPGRGLGSRLKRFLGGEKQPLGAPYKTSPNACSLHSPAHRFAVQFIGGFPEQVYFELFTPSSGVALLPRWAAVFPIARLRFGPTCGDDAWPLIHGPHLRNLVEVAFDRLTPLPARLMAHAPHLNTLKSLKVTPAESAVVRTLVQNPTWAGLRSLTFTGITAPAALHALAEYCTLEQLEELSFSVGGVPAPPPIPGVVGEIAEAVTTAYNEFVTTHPMPRGPIDGPDYWPAFFALARSPILPLLRRLRVREADHGWIIRAAEMLYQAGETDAHFAPFLSDQCVRAVADALNRDKLERLELPRARLSPACREELIRRFDSRVVFT